MNTIEKSALFTELTISEEASLSGGNDTYINVGGTGGSGGAGGYSGGGGGYGGPGSVNYYYYPYF